MTSARPARFFRTTRTARTAGTAAARLDGGFTLIEVLVAMMVFALIAVLVAGSLTLSMSLTRSNRASEVAANLAAQQIDIARSATNVFSVTSGSTTTTLDGTTYTVTRTAGWVTSTGAVADCGGAAGLLQNKTLNVAVSWSGMRPGTNPVQASTLLAPAGPINDPTSGTIIVHVTGATGLAKTGIPIGVKPDTSVSPNTATTISPAPSATDADGCSFILKAVPGTYAVTIGKTGDGLVNTKQVNAPTYQVPVTAGQSSVIDTQYDTASSPVLTLAPGSAAGTLFPAYGTLPLSFLPQGDPYTTTVTPTITSGVAKSSIPLFPWSSGYQVFAGAYVNGSTLPSCLSVDPDKWITPNAAGTVGHRADPIPIDPGATGGVAMPTVRVTVSSGTFLVAVSKAPAATVGDPGCKTGMSLKYSASTGSSATIALPYGSWSLYAFSSKTAMDSAVTSGSYPGAIGQSAIALPAGSPAWTSGTVFTVDPRLP